MYVKQHMWTKPIFACLASFELTIFGGLKNTHKNRNESNRRKTLSQVTYGQELWINLFSITYTDHKLRTDDFS